MFSSEMISLKFSGHSLFIWEYLGDGYFEELVCDNESACDHILVCDIDSVRDSTFEDDFGVVNIELVCDEESYIDSVRDHVWVLIGACSDFCLDL